VFCLFMPTDKELRDACFAVGDTGKMMFGLVNHIAEKEPKLSPTSTGKIPADQLAALEIYHRSRDKKDVIPAAYFDPKAVPAGFDLEMNVFPGERPPAYPPVIVHHKFIVIDAETDAPTIYTGSANMSGNSVFGNDENLLEIKGSPRLGRIYLAEFMRLYEHYRARAHYISYMLSGGNADAAGFALTKDRSWANADYKPGTPEYRARIKMLSLD
jgi:phosphatidylserine/phosphatidylglycerophosphate/cardiolipin synthase-like enzyme